MGLGEDGVHVAVKGDGDAVVIVSGFSTLPFRVGAVNENNLQRRGARGSSRSCRCVEFCAANPKLDKQRSDTSMG